MSGALSAAPWKAGDPEFKEHQATCFICNHDGEPSKDAYRPHTLAADCWCIRNSIKTECKIAHAWGVRECIMAGELIQCGLSARVIA